MTTAVAVESRASEYALKVKAGDILVGRAVRLACERHLKDLDRSAWDPNFPFEFDDAVAERACDFFPTFLTLEEGDPFLLADWQCFITGSIFGWVHRESGNRRFRHAYIETAKGSGKTPWLAGIGLYGLVIDDEPAAEIYSAATQREQAMIMLRDAIRMASDSPDLREIIEIGKYQLSVEETHSFFRAVSSEHRSKSGPRPHMALVDELHEHRDGTVVDKMKAGFKRRQNPIEVDITNSGDDTTSVCWEHRQRTLDVLEGVQDDDTWFGYVCHLDPCAECFEKGYRQPRDGCSECDDWTDPKVWPKANPSLGITIEESYLRDQVEAAIRIPSKQALIKRLNFCIWTQTHQVWIKPDDWRACQVKQLSVDNRDRLAAAAGLDLSSKLDLSACVVALRHDTEEEDPETVDIETVDLEGERVVKKLTLNFKIELIPWFWLPEETLVERVKTERIPYDVWRKQGHLGVTPGGVIDYELIYQTIVGDIQKRYRLAALGYDPRDATQLAVQLRDRGRVNVVELPQGRKLSEAYKLIEALIRSRRLLHDGNEVLGWNFSNAEPKFDKYENLWIEKPSGNKRIDGAVASAMAVTQLMLIPQRRRKKIRVSFHTSGGIRDLRAVPKKRRGEDAEED